ncbi:hypothetical protein O181_001370 [Austropuccinia psidii MF-1]|uniref:Uncharacterized protein n=1 Tax=Austropuccinia psidii MF-1 TaxID=1389203 RepID=A0A9Q3BAV3_9BASI|nr:hypothetical protein [Austropuccinia psidii MF-1]
MGDSIREQSEEYQDPREEFLVEYQEETQLYIQEIQSDAGMPQDTANENLCKHTTCIKIPSYTKLRNGSYKVAKEYMDSHFPNLEKKLFPTKGKPSKGASGKRTSIGTIIKEIIIPHMKGNIILNTEFVLIEHAHMQGFLLGRYYQRMYGIDI